MRPLASALALSPDGRTLVFADVQDGLRQLYRRDLEILEQVMISGSERAEYPVFSPDGQRVGFFVEERVGGGRGSLQVVDLAGGPAAPFGDFALGSFGSVGGVHWWRDNEVVVGSYGSFGSVGAFSGEGIKRMTLGGEVEPVTTVDVDRGEASHSWPHVLPPGNGALFTIAYADTTKPWDIGLVSLETGEHQVLLQGHMAQYAASGHIAFSRGDSLWVVSFDADSLELLADPVPVV